MHASTGCCPLGQVRPADTSNVRLNIACPFCCLKVCPTVFLPVIVCVFGSDVNPPPLILQANRAATSAAALILTVVSLPRPAILPVTVSEPFDEMPRFLTCPAKCGFAAQATPETSVTAVAASRLTRHTAGMDISLSSHCASLR